MGKGKTLTKSFLLGALGGNAGHEGVLQGLTAGGALALNVGGSALGGGQSSDEARNLGDGWSVTCVMVGL